MTLLRKITDTIEQLGQKDPGLVLVVGVIGVFFLCGIVFALRKAGSEFFEELRLINMDIAHSRDKEERKYYRRLRLKLFLSLLLFFRE